MVGSVGSVCDSMILDGHNRLSEINIRLVPNLDQ